MTADDMLVGWDEIAGFLRVSVVTAIKYRKEGGLPVIQLFTGKVRASRAELLAWVDLQGQEVKPTVTNFKQLK